MTDGTNTLTGFAKDINSWFGKTIKEVNRVSKLPESQDVRGIDLYRGNEWFAAFQLARRVVEYIQDVLNDAAKYLSKQSGRIDRLSDQLASLAHRVDELEGRVDELWSNVPRRRERNTDP